MFTLNRPAFIKFLLILAFFTAGISPACEFVSGRAGNSGKSFIEICSSDGSLQRIEVDNKFNPLADAGSGGSGDGDSRAIYSGKSSKHKSKSKNCNFCFASVHFVKNMPVISLVAPPDMKYILPLIDKDHAHILMDYLKYNPRAPPVFLS